VEHGRGAGSDACSGSRTAARARANEAMNRYASGDDEAFAALYPALAPELRRYS